MNLYTAHKKNKNKKSQVRRGLRQTKMFVLFSASHLLSIVYAIMSK